MQFFLPMIPPTATHQQKGIRVQNGKPVVYEKERVTVARAKLAAHLTAHRPPEPLTGPLRLVVKWCFPAGKHPDGTYKPTRPDTDKLNKLLQDVMTDLHFWKDDAQVASEIIEKFWAEVPGIWIRVEQLEKGEA